MTEPKNERTKGDAGGSKTGDAAGSKTGNVGSTADDVRKAFAGLPLDQKVSTLVQVELDMLGDAVSSVVSAVSTVVDDIAKACEPYEQTSSAAPDTGSQGPTS
jgi:hypothetical protein